MHHVQLSPLASRLAGKAPHEGSGPPDEELLRTRNVSILQPHSRTLDLSDPGSNSGSVNVDDNGAFWNWVLNRKLAFGPSPESEADAKSLRRHGFTALLDLDQGNRENESRWAEIDSLRYQGRKSDRMRESFQPIALDELETIANRIRDLLQIDGEVLYVHCGAGCGRSPTAVAAYLVRTGRSLEEAERIVKRDRECVWQGTDRTYRENLGTFAKDRHKG